MKNKLLCNLLVFIIIVNLLGFLSTNKSNALSNINIRNSHIIAGNGYILGLKNDSTVVMTRSDYGVSAWNDIVSIAGLNIHVAGLKPDGSVVASGNNMFGQIDVSDWRDIVAIECGYYSTLGLKSDGTVVAIGDNRNGQLNVSSWKDIVAVATGLEHTIGLESDGTVVGVGNNDYGQINVSSWSNIVAIAAGYNHTIGLRSDGTVVAIGKNENGELNVSSWSNIVAIAAAGNHTIGLKSDGTVVAVGKNESGELNVSSWSNIVAVDTAYQNTVGMKSDGTVMVAGYNSNRWNVEDWVLKTYNKKPQILLDSLDNQILSENNGYNKYNISGTASDQDNNDEITIKYTLTNTDMNNDIAEHTDKQILSYISNGDQYNFSDDINIDSVIPEGNYKLAVTATDSDGEKSETIKNFTVDKTPPQISEMSSELTLNSITVSFIASDEVSLAEKPYRFTIEDTSTDWLTNSSYTFTNLLPNKRYTIKTEVSDNVGNINSSTKNIYTKAEVPTITAINPTSITLDIAIEDNNPSNTAYQIVNTSNNNYITPLGEETTSPTWVIPNGKTITINGLTPLTTYTYKVKAKNEEGTETEFSSPASGTTLDPPPGMVPEVTATATSNEITIYWTPVADATSYEVEADDVIIDNGINVSFTHTELLPGTEHTYRVRAKKSTVAGEWSEAISKSTLPLLSATPTNINTLSTGNTITLTWSAVGNATSYDVEVDGEVILNGNSTNYVHTGLLSNTTHGYRVRSINPAGKSQWSSEVTATTLEESLPTPTNIIVNSGKTSIEISWEEIVGMEYQIEVDGNIVDNGINTVYTHSGLTPDTEYTYRVRTFKAGSYSDWSSLLTVSTKPDTFTTPSNIQSSATDTSITITWEEVTDADGYEIEVDGNIVDNGLNTSFTHNGLQSNSSHAYRIRAKQGETVSEWSTEINVTTYLLATPNNVITNTTENEIVINWDPVANATSYEIEVDDNLIKDITDTTYTVSGLYPGSQCKIQVRAINENGTSSFSLLITAITKASSNGAPQNITALTARNQITLMWEPIEGAVSYDIDVNEEVISEIASNIYTHEGLQANTSYTYKIRVNKTDGVGEWSETITITTMPIAPGAPENIIASATIDAVRLSWDKAENAEEYEIETNGQIIDAGTSTDYLITGLTPNTDYSFKVRGKNQTSVGSWSETITINTKSAIQDYTLQGSIGEEKNLVLNALSIKNWDKYTFTITYDPEEIEIVDICSQTSRQDLTLGNIIGSDIEVTQSVQGTLQFKKLSQIPIGQTYSGIINSIKIKFKTDAEVTITYTIQ